MTLLTQSQNPRVPDSSAPQVYLVSDKSRSRSIQRLADAFRNHGQFPIGDLAPLACNIRALEAASDFSRGIHRQVVIIGPCGWGKSQLLNSASVATQLYKGKPGKVCDATQWALEGVDVTNPTPLVLDDVQDAVRSPRARHLLRECLAKRAEFKRPTLLGFTGSAASRELYDLLPDKDAWVFAAIREPDVQDREIVVRQIGRKKGLRLSREAERVVARLVAGNARSIEGAMNALDFVDADLSKSRNALRVCGPMLNYLVSGTEWDPRDLVGNIVYGVLKGTAGRKVVREIACYILCRDMDIQEFQVAEHLQFHPTEVWRWVRIVEELLIQPEVAQAVEACRNAVFQTLCQL